MGKAKTIGIISIKGGVGKTTVVSNLGAALAQDYGKKVLLVDANFSTPHCGLHVGLLNPPTTVHHVLRGEASPFNALYSHEAGFHVMPGSLTPKNVSPLKLKDKLVPLKDFYDVILLDSSPALNDEMLATIVASDELLVVSSLDYPTLSATLHAVKIAKQKKTPIRGIVINKARNKRFELPVADIEKAAGVPVLAVVPDDISVLEALSATMPATLYAPKKSASLAYRRLAGDLIEANFVDPRLLPKMNRYSKLAVHHTKRLSVHTKNVAMKSKEIAQKLHKRAKILLNKKIRIGR